MDRDGLLEYGFAMELPDILPPELEVFWRTDDGRTAIQRAEAYGIDLSLLEENLRLTPVERLERNERAWELVASLRGAMKNERA